MTCRPLLNKSTHSERHKWQAIGEQVEAHLKEGQKNVFADDDRGTQVGNLPKRWPTVLLFHIEQSATLCSKLRDLALDQSQVSLVASPRNHKNTNKNRRLRLANRGAFACSNEPDKRWVSRYVAACGTAAQIRYSYA